MPAIASLEDSRAVQNVVRCMVLAVFRLQLAPYDLRSMGNAQDRLEECLQIMAPRRHSRLMPSSEEALNDVSCPKQT